MLFGGVKVVKVALANGVATRNADAAGARQLTQAVIGWGRQGRRPSLHFVSAPFDYVSKTVIICKKLVWIFQNRPTSHCVDTTGCSNEHRSNFQNIMCNSFRSRLDAM
ncbi:hypothetical protein ARMGADRAFT_1036614 [Armillaria gallica]|uniref:Uncharacterized protein n=1 Tax=Armillaria gallica TaxID=47427 RepID=A0A2H3CPZ9_ARMGA|nr:hypothetical protein ARMGADRAFT_1036614 [Armillaria gallica]